MHHEPWPIRYAILLVVLAAGIFLADVFTPLGYISGAPYLIVIALASLFDAPRLTKYLTILCSGFMVLGAWIYPVAIIPLSVVAINRLTLLLVLWIIAGLVLRNQRMRGVLKRQQRALKAANAKLADLALRDGLTNLPNRRSFDERLALECGRAARKHTPLSLLMIDIDYFKRYNDSLGHQAGDDCLIQVAHALHTEFRRVGDMAARYGGEEFAVILPDTGPVGALERAEILCRAVAALALPHPGNPQQKCVTISVGVATMDGRQHAWSPAELIQTADAGLYLAKQQGRNRVCVAHQASGQVAE